MVIRIYKTARQDDNFWPPIIRALRERGLDVHYGVDPSEHVDLSIILSAKTENPFAAKGKRVGIINRKDWEPDFNDLGWNFMEPIVKHYYDEFVDITNLPIPEIIKSIEGYIAKERTAHKS